MSTAPASRSRPRRGFRALPVWLQFGLSFSIAAALILAVVLYVDHVGNDTAKPAPITSPNALKEQNREANILVRQDQTPHTASLGAGVAPADGLRSAVVRYMNHQIQIGVIGGPLSKTTCVTRSGGSGSAEVALRCDATAADVTYPFYGVVEPKSRQITYCKKDQPPVPSMNVPLSPRCL